MPELHVFFLQFLCFLQRSLELSSRLGHLRHQLSIVLIYLVYVILVLYVLRFYVLGVLHITLGSDSVSRSGLRRRHVGRELAQLTRERVQHLLLRVQLRLEARLRLCELLLVHYVFCLLLRVESLNLDVLLLHARERLFELVRVLSVRRELQIRFLEQPRLVFDRVLRLLVLRERLCHNLLHLHVPF